MIMKGCDNMALINCPECGKEISDKSTQCIHCGYPIKGIYEKKYYTLFINEYLGETEKEINKQRNSSIKLMLNYRYSIKQAAQLTVDLPKTFLDGIEYDNIDFIVNQFKSIGCVITYKESNITTRNIINSKIENLRLGDKGSVICPRCYSTSITTGKRGFSMITGFIGSEKTVNRCSKCGFKWNPSL